jgi:hypothetical protein
MKLLLAAPCQMSLQDAETGHSLIAVFHEIKIAVPIDTPELPSNAIAPKEWGVFSKFGLTPDEEGKEYTLTTEIFWPDGNQLMHQELHAIQPTKNGMAFISRMQGFPMGQNGIVRVIQTLSSDGHIVLEPIEIEIGVVVEHSLNLPEQPK